MDLSFFLYCISASRFESLFVDWIQEESPILCKCPQRAMYLETCRQYTKKLEQTFRHGQLVGALILYLKCALISGDN